MNNEWTFVLDFALVGLLLASATVLKRKVSLFRKYLMPDAIIAGFLGLLAGPSCLRLIPLDLDRLGTLVYHLMAIGFIALTLKDRERAKNRDITNTGAMIVSTYLVQGILGFGLSLLLVSLVYPDLFPPFGLLLPLGFGQGPGQAYSIGRQWESLGFANGGNIGLSVAALGYIWACFGGVFLINFLIRRHKIDWQKQKQKQNAKKVVYETDHAGEMALSESIDKFSIQLALIGIVYLVTYLTISGVSIVLKPFGTFGTTLSQLLWGFHFIIASLYALLTRAVLNYAQRKGWMHRPQLSNYLLQRISGGCFDFMIAAAIAGISLTVLREYLVPTLIITTLGGILTMVYICFVCKRLYRRYGLENTLALYGMLTGTISTGLALLREVDPDFSSPSAEYMVLGSGVGLAFGFPMMILLNLPTVGYVNQQPVLYFLSMLGFVAYLIILGLFMYWNRPKNITAGPLTLGIDQIGRGERVS
ncbi:MAG: sodium:glutamate symporter [Firmicutes bacterium]|nr:sodium:glutamate symporter [Bacillota bacterium]